MTPPGQRFRLIATDADNRLDGFAEDVRAGLTSWPKRLSCRYFYDATGSHLFEEICKLPEYYLPRAEQEILQAHADEIAAPFPPGTALVELGSGNAAKTRVLIEAFLRRHPALRYVPIDISRTALEKSSWRLLADYPGLEIVAVAGEYHDGIAHLDAAGPGIKLVLWLGSNVGNFDRPDAARFLRRVRDALGPNDRVLVGIDLRKDRVTLERAYDDSQGVTAQFNLNLLTRINRELGGHFDPGSFRHRAVYNQNVGRVEIYLDSLRDQRVAIDQLELQVTFQVGEAVHTENSYKYASEEIAALAGAAGLQVAHLWFDLGRRFATAVLCPSTRD